MSPRKFWRHYLPRLKYYNPAVSMTVHRFKNTAHRAKLTVTFSDPSDSTTGERKEMVVITRMPESQILHELLTLTKGREVEPTKEELEQMAELQEQLAEAKKDEKNSRAYMAKIREDKRLLEQARQAVA
jgi:large subunit ribosomal protein MRP49